MTTTSQFKLQIIAAKAGNADALSEVFAGFRNYLWLLARLHVEPLLQAKFDESDIVQETCAQAVLAIHQFSGENEAEFGGWLRQILANKGALLARQYVATHQRDVTLERQLEQRFDRSSAEMARIVVDPADSPSQQAVNKEEVMAIADALARIKADQREVLIMHGLEGAPIQEVAKRMGRGEAATWKLWARGLQALRKQFREK